MFTVVVCLEASGKMRTLRPLSSVYSVMPSTVAPFFIPAGSWALAMEGSASMRADSRSHRARRCVDGTVICDSVIQVKASAVVAQGGGRRAGDSTIVRFGQVAR